MKHKNEIMHIKWCRHCGQKFQTTSGFRSCCSRQCSLLWGMVKKLRPVEDKYKIRKIHIKTPQEHAYKRYKDCAKKRGIKFTISQSYFNTLWNKPCHYCGRAIETIGIDRSNNAEGYIPDNLNACCRWCNWMKSKRNSEEFVSHCLQIVKHLKDKRVNAVALNKSVMKSMVK